LFFFFAAGLFGDVWISRILPQPKSSVFFSAGKFFRERRGEGDEEKAALSALSVSYPLGVKSLFYSSNITHFLLPHFPLYSSKCKQCLQSRFSTTLMGLWSCPGFSCIKRSYARRGPSVKCIESTSFQKRYKKTLID
jgi:hypothetical protein